MLILTRRPGESLVIETPSGERIDVKVLSGSGDQARFGITANKRVTVDREEIYEQRKVREAS